MKLEHEIPSFCPVGWSLCVFEFEDTLVAMIPNYSADVNPNKLIFQNLPSFKFSRSMKLEPVIPLFCPLGWSLCLFKFDCTWEAMHGDFDSGVAYLFFRHWEYLDICFLSSFLLVLAIPSAQARCRRKKFENHQSKYGHGRCHWNGAFQLYQAGLSKALFIKFLENWKTRIDHLP